jgi:hypothetical protein
MKGNGTKRATSQGDFSLTDAAIPFASVIASSFVEGFNFQFPVINGLLAHKGEQEPARKLDVSR